MATDSHWDTRILCLDITQYRYKEGSYLPHTSSVRTADLNGGVCGAPHHAVGDTRTAAAGGAVLLGANNTSPS